MPYRIDTVIRAHLQIMLNELCEKKKIHTNTYIKRCLAHIYSHVFPLRKTLDSSAVNGHSSRDRLSHEENNYANAVIETNLKAEICSIQTNPSHFKLFDTKMFRFAYELCQYIDTHVARTYSMYITSDRLTCPAFI